MVHATEYKPMTAFQLAEHLQRFISDNERAHGVEERWLADELKAALLLARAVRNNNIEPAMRARISAFRASELEAEIEAKRREVQNLERDLKKVKAA